MDRGGHVFWAANGDEACAYIKDLAVSRGVKTVVKSKSMVTEEIHLAPVLEEQGIRVWETDLGEFIVQLRNEAPYHIVTPAMHLDRNQIRDLFREKLGEDIPDADPQKLVALARRKLREAFFAAEMGISGANFLVADAGAVAISTNEGNGRLSTSLPRIHVAVTGIEKVIPRLEDLGTLWPVLATSGTGQPITTYSTLVGGPKRADEADGPEEFHVVLLDNGRSGLLANAEEREVLHCIRCGACLNICPVYRNIGGHTYNTTYPGPIGSVLTPHLRGSEFQHLSYASSLCGACTSVCPVNINLHHHLLHNRRDFTKAGGAKTSGERAAVQAVEDGHAASAALRAGRMDDAPQLAPAVWHGTRRNRARPYAGLEPQAHTGATAFAVVPCAMEKRAFKKRPGEDCRWQQVIPAAKQS